MSRSSHDFSLHQPLLPQLGSLQTSLLRELCSSIRCYNATNSTDIDVQWDNDTRAFVLKGSSCLASTKMLLPACNYAWRLECLPNRNNSGDFEARFIPITTHTPFELAKPLSHQSWLDEGRPLFLPESVPRGARIVSMNQSGFIERAQGQPLSIATYGLCGCSAIILISADIAFIAHYPPPFNETLKYLIKGLAKPMSNCLRGGKGFIITPGQYQESAPGIWQLEVKNHNHADQLKSIVSSISSEIKPTMVPYSELLVHGKSLQGIATVKFSEGDLPQVYFEGSLL